MNITELEKLAKAATKDYMHHVHLHRFYQAANPAVIIELIALVRLQHEALEKAREDIADWGSYASDYFQQKWDLNLKQKFMK